jgi:hypothetical protein
MNKHYSILTSAVAAVLLLAGTGMPALAISLYGNAGVQSTVSASSSPSGVRVGADASVNGGAELRANIIAHAKERADEEIARRVKALSALSTRVNAMVHLSGDQKSSLSATIQAQIDLMNTLQGKIDADASSNSTSSLKADIQSIGKAYRVFLLVIPQGAIQAAADRVMTIGGMFTQFAAKLQTRISDAQNAGIDMSASVTALADMNAKIADANAQAQAAVNETASLQPDNGDQTVLASNTTALKDARAKLQTAQKDLVAARSDAGTIVKALTSIKVSATASSTTNAY